MFILVSNALSNFLWFSGNFFFFYFVVSVHNVLDKINCLDSHETHVFVIEFSDLVVFYKLNYLVIGCLVHGDIIFVALELFAICIIGLLTLVDCGFYVMAGLVSTSFCSFCSVPVSSVVYMVSFIIRPAFLCLPPIIFVFRVVVFA